MKILAPKRALTLLEVLLILAFPVVGLYAGQPRKPKAPPKPQYISITKIDLKKKTITYAEVNGHMKEKNTLKVNDQTEIQVNGQPGTFKDLHAGMQVDVTMAMDPQYAARLVAGPAPTPAPTPIPRPR
jgi:hypothetical protein